MAPLYFRWIFDYFRQGLSHSFEYTWTVTFYKHTKIQKHITYLLYTDKDQNVLLISQQTDAVDGKQRNVDNCYIQNGKHDRMIQRIRRRRGPEYALYQTLLQLSKHKYWYRWAQVAGVGKVSKAYSILVWKPEGKRPFMRHKGRSDNIIKMLLGVWTKFSVFRLEASVCLLGTG
jgi:hypothetical protein